MANEDVRVLIGEIDGYEYDNPKEHKLVADQVPFDNSTNGFLSVWTQDAIEEAKNSSRHQSFFQATLFTTTSNNWVNIFDELASTITNGKYLVLLTLEQSQTNKNKNLGLLFRHENDTLVETEMGVATDNEWKIISFHKVMQLVTGARFRVDHGQTSSGGTAMTKNVSLLLLRLGD